MYKAGQLSGLEGITSCVIDANGKYVALCPFEENAVMIADIFNQIENGTCVFIKKPDVSVDESVTPSKLSIVE